MTIKTELIQVSAQVLRCDACGRRGPDEMGDAPGDTVSRAIADGWSLDDAADLCPRCLKEHSVKAATKHPR